MMISGSMTIVFGFSAIESLIYNLIPLLLFCISCYYLDSKFQLAFAKLLTLVYSMLMLAVYVGLIMQIAAEGTYLICHSIPLINCFKGWLSPTAFSAASFFLPLIFAGLLHIEEAHNMIYMPVYLVTIPSMYILLVIYSLFNLWNTGWGTREKKAADKTEAEKREDEQIQKELDQEKKAGVMETFMGQFSFGDNKSKGNSTTKNDEKGSVDFSCGNIMRCLCFTHEDPNDPHKHLEKIGDSLKEVSQRLYNIERSNGIMSTRRRSSIGMRSGISNRRPSSITEGDENQIGNAEQINVEQVPEEMEEEVPLKERIDRDDYENPYWMDDPKLKEGKLEDLKLEEINFWEKVIKDYLTPFNVSRKETEVTKRELFEYRDSFIFTFVMINAFYIVLITMLQVQTPLKIPWTILAPLNLNGADGLIYTFDYNSPDNMESPEVTIYRETAMLDMLGLVFLLTFSSITYAQIIGMVLHRWQTCNFFLRLNHHNHH